MQDFFLDSLVFGAKSSFVFILFCLLTLVSVFATVKALNSGKSGKKGESGNLILEDIQIVNLTSEYRSARKKVASKIFSGKELDNFKKSEKEKELKEKNRENGNKRLFVLSFDGDISASQADVLGREIDALLGVADSKDEVMLRLNSPGGTVVGYGYAASQLMRLRSRGIRLTVCVDKIAASGGYMMACIANYIVAAPFSIVGSIGVVAEFPNFHRLLGKLNIDYEQETAGEYKRTLSMFGDNTDPKAREKFKQDLEQCHVLFKNHISKYRPQVKIEEVATGEFWHGTDAMARHLVDEIGTSNEFITSKLDFVDVYEFRVKKDKGLKSILQKMSLLLKKAAGQVL
jgi:serine protease SohB